MKVLIDTDPGKDDAIALGMILSRKDIDVVGITCVAGNVSVEHTTKNALKILEAFDRKDIPVFKGAYSPIIGTKHTGKRYHGSDGMGDVLHYEPDKSPLKDEIAANAINRLCHEHKGEITMIALGPMTNLALAFRLNKALPETIKDLVIMGGNYKGEGNISMAAEFNFFMDSISAHVVLEEFTCPIYLITWELSKINHLTNDHFTEYVGRDNKKSKFMKSILKSEIEGERSSGYCDSVATAVATNREIVTKKHEVFATVEINGGFTKGAVVIDWNPQFREVGDQRKANVIIVDEIDADLYRKLLLQSTM